MFKSLLRGILAIACGGMACAQVVQDFAPTKGVGYQTQWSKRLGSAIIRAMSGTSDGGMFVAGDAPNSSNLDVWVAKLAADGTVTWQYRFGKDGTEGAAALAPTSDGGLAVVGTSSSFPPGYSLYLIKLSSSGDPLWQRVIDSGTGFEYINAMAETDDGGLVLVGTTANTSSSNDIWVL